MNELLDRIVAIRRQVSPRTSYAVSGAAASTILLVGHDADMIRNMGEGLLRTGEFDKYQHMNDIHEGNMMQIQGHVIVFVNPMSLIVHRLFEQKRTNLVFISMNTTGNSELLTIIQQASTSMTNIKTAKDDFVSISTKLITFYANNQSSSSSSSSSGINNRSIQMPTSYGFNQQPSVQSRRQFAFLWNGATSTTSGTTTSTSSSSKSLPLSHATNHPMSPAMDAKLRVLQRLADRELLDKSKWSVEKWDDVITSLLAQGGDDYVVYSMLRERYLGKTLEESLRIDLDPSSMHLSQHTATTITSNTVTDHHNNNKSEVVGGGNGTTEEESPDGRAGYMVDMTVECIPEGLLKSGQIKTLLDYGCAEGAITDQLCRKLHVSSDRAYGADVRALRPVGFTFVLLPAEQDIQRPLSIDQPLLPMLANDSIDLVTAAMVFHHVKHIQTALTEIRRIISPQGAFVIREHHCTSPEMAAFLDIVHGLYGLAWKDPVEDPRFLDEYQAYYRSREDWNQIMEQHGFIRVSGQAGVGRMNRHYNSAEASIYKEHQKKFPNVIKAYYCTYIPDPKKPFSWVLQEQNRWLLRKEQERKAMQEKERQNETKRKRDEEEERKTTVIGSGSVEVKSSSSGSGSSSDSGIEKKHRLDDNSGNGGINTGIEVEKELWESKKYPGKFYMLDGNNAPVWIEFLTGGSGGAGSVPLGSGGSGGGVTVEGIPVQGALFVDPRCKHIIYRANKITTLPPKQ